MIRKKNLLMVLCCVLLIPLTVSFHVTADSTRMIQSVKAGRTENWKCPKKIGKLIYNDDAYSYKGYIYSTYLSATEYVEGAPIQAYLYRMKPNGTKCKRIRKLKLKGPAAICLIHSNRIYLESIIDSPDGGFENGYTTAVYDMKRKKESYYKRTMNQAVRLNKNYYWTSYLSHQDYLCENGCGLLQVKTGKFIFFSSKFVSTAIVGKKVFAVTQMTDGKMSVYSFDLKGKHAKKQITFKISKEGYCLRQPHITKTVGKKIYIKLEKSNDSNKTFKETYIYNIKTGKVHKTK